MPAIIAAVAPAVIGAASSAAGGAGGATTPPNVNTSYSQNTTLPSWYGTAQDDLINALGPAEQTAIGLENPQGFQTFVNSSANVIGQDAINPSLNEADFASYMSPYLDDVVGGIESAGNRNLLQNVLPAINSTFTHAGQFGSDVNGAWEGNEIYNTQQAEDQAIAQALGTGYGQALSGYEAGQTGALQAGEALGNLGAQYQTEVGQGITQELAPVTAEGQIINGMQVPTSISGSGQAPLPGAIYGPGIGAQLGSGVAAGIGAYNAQNPSMGSGTNATSGSIDDIAPQVTKRGGRITKRQPRGALRHAAA